MARSLKFFRNPQFEVAGFIAAAFLSIPLFILAAYGIYHLIRVIF